VTWLDFRPAELTLAQIGSADNLLRAIKLPDFWQKPGA